MYFSMVYLIKTGKDTYFNMNFINNYKKKEGLLSKNFLKVLLLILAVGNLGALFIFDYSIPGVNSSSSNAGLSDNQTTTNSLSKDDSSADSLTINLPEGKMTYDGSGSFDLSDGVIVTDASGNVVDNKIFTSIKTGDSIRNKIVEYSVEDSDGNIFTATRDLELSSSYHGPSIEVFGDIPLLTYDELNNISRLLIDSGLIKGDDGFGKDITSTVTSSVKSEDPASGSAIVTLSAVNMFNDTFSLDVTVQYAPDGPILKLTTNRVTINKGESFDALRYVEYARDENGQSLSSRIRVSGSVDINTPGEYSIEIYATNYEGLKTPVQTLKVTVK